MRRTLLLLGFGIAVLVAAIHFGKVEPACAGGCPVGYQCREGRDDCEVCSCCYGQCQEGPCHDGLQIPD